MATTSNVTGANMNNLSIYYQNVRGLRTKCLDFYNGVLRENHDLILITESWLQGDVLDSELTDPRYDIFRCDRDLQLCNKSRGGGVLICAHRKLQATVFSEWISDTAESLCVKVPAHTLSSDKDLFIAVVYTPPDLLDLSTRFTNLKNNITKLLDIFPDSNYLLVGDFNLPCIKWDSYGFTILRQGSTDLQTCAEDFLDHLHFLGLIQYNSVINTKNKILDLCFSDLPLEITRSQQTLIKEDNYHPSLSVNILDLNCKSFKEKITKRLNFHKADYDAINNYFTNIDWLKVLSHDSIDVSVSKFYDKLSECCNLFVPLSKSTTARSHYPAWYSKSLIKLNKQKNKIHKKWKRFRNPRDYDEYNLLRNRFKRMQEQCFKEFTARAEVNIKRTPKYFWTYVKSKRGSSNYPKQFTLNNNVFSEGQIICNAFNTFFENVFVSNASSPGSSDSTHSPPPNNQTISQINISPNKVYKLLSSLDKSKGAGYDGIPSVFLSRCAKSLAFPIFILFYNSLKQCTFPAMWKKALIIPIHKKGSKTLISNYRPISILCCIAKLFEKIVYDNIYQLIAHGVPTSQHGFLKGRSTVSNLAVFTNYVLKHMEGGGQVDVVYTDFEKAFDRVDHVILLQKLESLGIHGDLLRWITSYLSNRSQAVVLGGYRSDFITVPSGVPQGSHLGPLFYNAYIFDINSCFGSANHLLYADDKKIFMKINSITDCLFLQRDLNNLMSYYSKNNITISIPKCQCISFTRKKKPIIFPYNFDNIPIERVEVIRDLGILLDSGMSFSNHIDNIVKRSYQSLGFVIRTCKPFTTIMSLKIIYYAYIRSILEYACQIWCPFYAIHKNRIENIQRKFVRYLNYKFNATSNAHYSDSCREYRILTLEQRRKVLDLGLLHDVVSGRLDCPELVSQLMSLRAPARRTRHTPLFAVASHHTNYAQNSVLTRIANCYNTEFGDIDPFIYSKKTFLGRIRGALQ